VSEIIPLQLSLTLFGDNFELYPNGLVVKGEPTEAEFDDAFKRLKTVEDATAWWYGDLALARDKQYGSLKEMAERLEINYQSLNKYQVICRAYPEVGMRIPSISFTHHQTAAPLDNRLEWLQKAADEGFSAKELKMQILRSGIEAPSFDGVAPRITKSDYKLWLPNQPDCDLLLTDPPYSTDINEPIESFSSWLPQAIAKVKPTGHAYVFFGSYPREIKAYLDQVGDMIDQTQLLVWEYKNTMGPSPTHEYKTNWQAILYYRGKDAEPLDVPMLLEQNSVQEFSMPTGKDNPYHHQWEKPTDLAERFIRHTTKKGDIVLDPFAGTGVFLATAAKFGRIAHGCDISEDMINLALARGCENGNG